MDSPPPSVRAKNAEAKRDAILQAALRLFAEQGFHGTAVPEVSAAAGVGAGTIYRYFENKEALVNSVYCHAKRQMAAYLLDDFNYTASRRDQFHQFWERLTRFAQDHPVAFKFLELQDHAPYLDEASKKLELSVLMPIWNFCEQAKAEGVSRNIPQEALIAMMWGAFAGVIKAQHLGYLKDPQAALREAENVCWDMFCRPGAS